jgi:hypothetical protein
MKKCIFILAVIALLFAGCAKRGEYVPVKSNDNFEVAFIFEVDGVKVYRFRDNGHFHYFAVKNTAVTLESTRLSGNGKTIYTQYAGTIPEAVE